MIRVKRIYEEPEASDGVRLLVDRVWPRGISKDRACIEQWRKDLAPSTALRKWFGHDPSKWELFRDRYRAELAHPDAAAALRELAAIAKQKTVTLVYGAADREHNQAVVLKEELERRSGRRSA